MSKLLYMETIEDKKKSLITFKHTGMQGTNLVDSAERNIILNKLYKQFWNDLINIDFPEHDGKIKNFCGEWTRFNEKFQPLFLSTFMPYVDVKEQCINIWKKFRGNCGEIYGEWFFRYGDCAEIEQSTYSTIDPDNENFTDATAESSEDGFPIGIQIKNWTTEISFDVFKSAGAQITQTAMNLCRQDSNIDLNKYFKIGTCRQIVFSTSARIWNKAMDIDNWLENGLIKFIGPKDIDAYMQKFTKDKFKKQITEKIINKL